MGDEEWTVRGRWRGTTRHRRIWLTVEPWPQDREGRAEKTRAVLRALAADVRKLQCDLPEAEHWPADVVAAAGGLRAADDKDHESGAGTYSAVGWLDADRPGVWDDFVTVAPYAYDTDCWDEDGELVSVTDEGASVALRLTTAQADRVAAGTGLRVVPIPRRGRRAEAGRVARSD